MQAAFLCPEEKLIYIFFCLKEQKKPTIFQEKVVHNFEFISVNLFDVNVFALKAFNNKIKFLTIDYTQILLTQGSKTSYIYSPK